MSTLSLKSILAVAALIGGSAFVTAQQPSPLVTQAAEKSVAVLQSPASTVKEKTDACRQLAVIGGPSALPALVALLPDEQLNHMARYALETIPDPAVDDALRGALDKLSGRPLVGVIDSLGVRRDRKAIPALSQRLRAPDADVAQAAARALGAIGTPDAAQAIDAALADVPAENRLAFCEGLLRATETIAATGDTTLALRFYDRLRNLADAPHQVRAGAWRGAILTRGPEGLALLRDAWLSSDHIQTAAAARAAMEMPGPGVTRLLTSMLDQLTGDKKVLALQVLGKRGDTAAIPALSTAAQGGDKAIRLAAIQALPELASDAAVAPLTRLLEDADGQIAKAAQEALAAIPGEAVDATVTKMLASSSPAERLTAIDLIGRRRMAASVPALMKAATDPDASVRPAALKRLGELSDPAQLPALLDLLVKAGSSADRDAAEQAVSAVSARAADPAASVSQVTRLLAAAQPEAKGALLRVLTSVGGPDALKAVRAALDNSNPEVRAAAIRAMGSWKTEDVAPELLALARSSGSPTEKLLALRGYFGWASNPELPAERRLAMCQQAAGVVQQPEDKKLLLGALGTIKTMDSFAAVAPHLDDAAVRAEAGAATIAIAEDLLKGREAAQVAAKLVGPLQKAAQSTANADLAAKAKALAEQAQKKAAQ